MNCQKVVVAAGPRILNRYSLCLCLSMQSIVAAGPRILNRYSSSREVRLKSLVAAGPRILNRYSLIQRTNNPECSCGWTTNFESL